MTFNKNYRVHVRTASGIVPGIIKDGFIQETKIEFSGNTLIAHGSEENPVYLIEIENGKKIIVREGAILIGSRHD